MKELILTEKPSVGVDFAKALGNLSRQEGWFEGSRYIVTWAIGHLVELLEPADYDPKWLNWSLDTLPIMPEVLEYQPSSNTIKQFRVIKSLFERKDLTKIVCATDAGREGELIFRTIAHRCKANGVQCYRFWSSQALTPEVIHEGLANAKPLSEYDRLYKAGRSRQAADWLVGINFSRFASVKFNGNFSVGRVQTAVLGLLVDRAREMENFVPVSYFLLKAKFRNPKGEWTGSWFAGDKNRLDQEAAAKLIENRISGKTGVVISATREIKEVAPPALFSLTDLQQAANRKYGFSAQKTLDIAQELYETKKCVSYPRTDARVLGSKNVEMLRSIFKDLAPKYPDIFREVRFDLITVSNKRIFNDAKLTDHHALIALKPLPAGASEDESRIYYLVLIRMAAAFHPDFIYEQTEVITEVERETFRTRGRVVVKPGWRTVLHEDDKDGEDEKEDNVQLPALAKDDPAPVVGTNIEAKQTTPPPLYTEASLLKDMANPSKFIEEAELKKIMKGDNLGLGTVATRAACLEALFEKQYIERKNKQLIPTIKGIFLIDALRRLPGMENVTHPRITAAWELELEKIAQGEGREDRFMAEIKKFVASAIASSLGTAVEAFRGESFGKCPGCGGDILPGKKGYGCRNWRPEHGGCTFVIWKQIAGKTIPADAVNQLLTAGKTGLIKGFKSREGKKFDARLQLGKDAAGRYNVNFIFVKPEESKDLKCPLCGTALMESDKAFSCSGNGSGCKFILWRTVAGKKLSATVVRELLTKGVTSKPVQGLIAKSKKRFEARLRLDGDKIVFLFTDSHP